MVRDSINIGNAQSWQRVISDHGKWPQGVIVDLGKLFGDVR